MLINDINIIKNLVSEAFAIGAAAVLKELKPRSDYLTFSRACALYTTARITDLIKHGQIQAVKIGARTYYSRMEINKAICESSVQLLFIRSEQQREEDRYGQQPTSHKRRVEIILGNGRKTRKA